MEDGTNTAAYGQLNCDQKGMDTWAKCSEWAGQTARRSLCTGAVVACGGEKAGPDCQPLPTVNVSFQNASTRNFFYEAPAFRPLAEGIYANRHSVLPGENITIFVGSTQASVTVYLYVRGEGWEATGHPPSKNLLGYFSNIPTTHPSAHCSMQDRCSWNPSFIFTIPNPFESNLIASKYGPT